MSLMDARALHQRPDLWVVAFVPASALAALTWWQHLLTGYRHVFAFRACGPEVTEVVNHTGRLLDFTVQPLPASELAARLAAEGMHLVATAPQVGGPRALLRGPMTCVEVVKALLGLRAPFVVTPRGLAAHLARRGAQIVITAERQESV